MFQLVTITTSVILVALLALLPTQQTRAAAAEDYSESDMKLSSGSRVLAQLTPDADFIPVCRDGISTASLNAICRQLGYTHFSTAYADVVPSWAKQTSGPVINSLQCPGGKGALSLAQCTFNVSDDIVASCADQLAVTCTSADPFLVRLNQKSYQLVVRSSAALNWGAVCSKTLTAPNSSSRTATNLCGMLGRPAVGAVLFPMPKPEQVPYSITEGVALGDLVCDSSSSAATSISDCKYATSPTCATGRVASELVGLYCSATAIAPPAAPATKPSSSAAFFPPTGMDVGGGFYMMLDPGDDPSSTGVGRVLVRRMGSEWGSVQLGGSSSSLQSATANAVCGLLGFAVQPGTSDAGYSYAPAISTSGSTASSKLSPSSPILIKSLVCPSSSSKKVTSLADCTYTSVPVPLPNATIIAKKNYSHSTDLFVRCRPTSPMVSGSYYVRMRANGILETIYASYYYGAESSSNTWLPLCGPVDDTTANAACRWLGFGSGVAVISDYSLPVMPGAHQQIASLKCSSSTATSTSSCSKTYQSSAACATNAQVKCTPAAAIRSGSWEIRILQSNKLLLLRPRVAVSSVRGFTPSMPFASVCYSGMSTTSASQICKLAGHSSGTVSYTYFGSSYPSTPAPRLGNIGCGTTAKSLDDCSFSSMTSCYRNRVATLLCRDDRKTPTVRSGDYLMRMDENTGAVELRTSSGSWSNYICDDGLASSSPSRLCFFLGYLEGGSLKSVSYTQLPGASSSKFIMKNLRCSSSAKDLSSCSYSSSRSGCSVTEIVGLTCKGTFSGKAYNESAAGASFSSGPGERTGLGVILGAVFGALFGIALLASIIGWCVSSSRMRQSGGFQFDDGFGGSGGAYSSSSSSGGGATSLSRSRNRTELHSGGGMSSADAAAAFAAPTTGSVALGAPVAGFAPGFAMSTHNSVEAGGTGDDIAPVAWNPPPTGYG